ncbi:MAG: M14-type cytosolic carboxypeptidase [Verrucomicrobiota bacterium]
MKVDIDFPGGSGEVITVNRDYQILTMKPSDHPGKGWRCWWYFKVTGLDPSEPLMIHLGDAPWATPDRAHFSTDNKTWKLSDVGERDGRQILYKIAAESDTVWVAWGPPFLPADAKELVDHVAAESSAAEAFNLCDTREGNATPAIRFNAGAKHLLWLQARQHAWESGSSWVAKGLIDYLAANPLSAEVVVVPIMDIDNVIRGAGGKNQSPQDHNRDWGEAPHWKAVAAAQKQLKAADEEGRLAAFIDLHNPGANDKQPFFFIPPREGMPEESVKTLTNFLIATQEEIVGPLRFSGKTIESGSNYDRNWQKISKNWVAENTRPGVVSVTLETSWNTRASTIEGYETVGEQLGKALKRYLETLN